VDGAARQGTRQTQTDENHHLAKVRVAGSNPAFRSQLLHQRSGTRAGCGPAGPTYFGRIGHTSRSPGPRTLRFLFSALTRLYWCCHPRRTASSSAVVLVEELENQLGRVDALCFVSDVRREVFPSYPISRRALE
jgi:hypothetical protein